MFKGEIVYDDDYLFSVSKVFTLCGEKISFTVNSEMCFEMYQKLAELSKIKEKFIENFGPAIIDDTMFFNKLKEFMYCTEDMQAYLEDILAQDEIFDIDADDVIKKHLPEALCEFEEYISDIHNLDLTAKKLDSYRAIQRETRDTGADMMFFGGSGIKGAMSAVLTSVVAGASVAAIQSVGDSITASNDKNLINKELVRIHKKYDFVRIFEASLNKMVSRIMAEYTRIVKTRISRYKYVESEMAKFISNDTNSVVLNNLEKQYNRKNISHDVFTSRIMQLIQENPYNYKCYNTLLRYAPEEAQNVNEIISFMGMEDMFEATIYESFKNIFDDFNIKAYPYETTLKQIQDNIEKLCIIKNEYINFKNFSDSLDEIISNHVKVEKLMGIYKKATIYEFLDYDMNGELCNFEEALFRYNEDYEVVKMEENRCIEAIEKFGNADLDFDNYSDENRKNIEDTLKKCFGKKYKSYINKYRYVFEEMPAYKKYMDYITDFPKKQQLERERIEKERLEEEERIEQEKQQAVKRKILDAMNRFEQSEIDFNDYSEKNINHILSVYHSCFSGVSLPSNEENCVSKKINEYLAKLPDRYSENISTKYKEIDFKNYSFKNANHIRDIKYHIKHVIDEINSKFKKVLNNPLPYPNLYTECDRYLSGYTENIELQLFKAETFVYNDLYDETIREFLHGVIMITNYDKDKDVLVLSKNYVDDCNAFKHPFDWSTETQAYIGYLAFSAFAILISFLFSLPIFLKIIFGVIIFGGFIWEISALKALRTEVLNRKKYKENYHYERNKSIKEIEQFLLAGDDYKINSFRKNIIVPDKEYKICILITIITFILLAIFIFRSVNLI